MQKRMRFMVAVLAVVLVTGAFSACSWFKSSKGAEEFSADLTTKDSGGTYTGKIYATKDKIRMDIADSSVIARFDNKVVYVLIPQIKQYMEQALDKVEHPFAGSGALPGETKREAAGSESVAGRKADKYKVTVTKDGKDEVVLQWLDAELKVPIKTAAEDASWSLEYSNVKVGDQPKDLFELPTDYSKLALPNMPAAMPSTMPGDAPSNVPGDVSGEGGN